MRYPIDLALDAYLDAEYPGQDIPLAYRQLIEQTWADAMCDIPSLARWLREQHPDEPYADRADLNASVDIDNRMEAA